MQNTLKQVDSASHREELASVRGVAAKATLRAQVSASALREIAGQAIRRTHGKAETAADVVGVSESQLGRLVNDGDLKLKHLEALGPQTLALLGRELVETYSALETPMARLREVWRRRRELDEEEQQIVEGLAS